MLYILNIKQEVVAVASNSNPSAMPYWEDEHIDNLEGVNTYEFKVPATHPLSELIEVNGHVIIRDYDGEHILFTIKYIEEMYDDFKPIRWVQCEGTAISELLTDIQRPVTYNSIVLETAARNILANTVGWELNKVDLTQSQDVVIEEYMTVMEALRLVVDQFDYEVYFTVELSGTRIVKKNVNIVKQRGNETNVRFDYGYNLVQITRTEDSSGLVTALIGVGKGDTEGTRITTASVSPFDDGDIYKPSGVDWIGSESALQRWSTNGKHIFGVYQNDYDVKVDKLKERTIAELKSRMKPFLRYSCSIADLEVISGHEAQAVRVGDTLMIKDTTFNPPIVITARVQEIKRSYTDPKSDGVDLGDYKTVSLSNSKDIRALQSTIAKNEEKWNALPYRMLIESSTGSSFKNNVGSTTLTAKILHGNNEQDAEGTAFLYKWYKKDKNGQIVPLWGGSTDYKLGKSVSITASEVAEKAVFKCSIDIFDE